MSPADHLPSPNPDQLRASLTRLVTDGTLTTEQADAVLHELTPSPPSAHPQPSDPPLAAGTPLAPSLPPWTALLAEVGGYVGGAFVLASLTVLLTSNWDHLSRATRLGVLGFSATAVLLLAVVLTRLSPDDWTPRPRHGTSPRRRLVSILLLLTGLLTGCTGAVAADGEYEATIAASAALLVLTASYTCCRAVALHIAMALAATLATTSGMVTLLVHDDHAHQEELVVGVIFLCLSLIWLLLTVVGVLTETATGLFLAGCAAFISGEILANRGEDTAGTGYLVLLTLAVAALAGYVRARHLVVLGVGVIALATVIPQAVTDYADGTLGVAGGLLVTGLSIVGASTIGFRLIRTRSSHENGDQSHPSS